MNFSSLSQNPPAAEGVCLAASPCSGLALSGAHPQAGRDGQRGTTNTGHEPAGRSLPSPEAAEAYQGNA